MIRQERTRANLTQRALARRAGLSPQYLNDVEHERRTVTLETAERIADALGMPRWRLVDAMLTDLVQGRYLVRVWPPATDG